MPYYQCPRCGSMDAYFQTEQVFGNSGSQNFYDRRGSYAGRSSGGVNVRNVRQAYCRHCVSVKMDAHLTGREKKFLVVAGLVVVAVVMIFWLLSNISRGFDTATAPEADPTALIYTPGKDDPVGQSFSASFALEESDGRSSSLRVRDIVVVDFPDSDFHVGFVRYLPSSHFGQNLSINLESVRDGSGSVREWQTYPDDPYLRVDSTSTAGTFLKGRQVFQYDYTLQDVLSEGGEFFVFSWELSATNSPLAWSEMSVQMFIEDSLARRADPAGIACSIATYEARVRACQIALTSDSAGRTVLEASHVSVPPYHTMHIEMRFFK